MNGRAVALAALVAVVVLLSSPVQGDPGKYKPPLPPPNYYGYLTKDSTCPVATHLLTQFCVNRPYVYAVFNRMKGVKRFENGALLVIHGPTIDTTSCSLPVVEATDIRWKLPPPPPCAPP
jgi:hypothetical protein